MKCKHYIRWYSPVCLECFSTKKYNDYMCHHCHNEVESHKMDRHKVVYMKCNLCHTYQKKSNKCINPDCYWFICGFFTNRTRIILLKPMIDTLRMKNMSTLQYRWINL